MNKKLYFFLLIGFILINLDVYAQMNKCKTMDLYKEHLKKNTNLNYIRLKNEQQTQIWINEQQTHAKTRNIITIPVVVHVIYKTANQNISDNQIYSQIDAMNEDFRLFNTDSLDDTHPFWTYTADTQIEFCLASTDPNGIPTTGITRTQTTVNSFDGSGNEKYTSLGGKDNWDPTKYLNIWVCDLSAGGNLLGYATFPSDLASFPDDDGVVINYTAFGTIGTAQAPNNLGRTGTHEVGHWLNLYHIWGDETCGDDMVSDTEVAFESNYGCPDFPYNANSSCGSGDDGEMFMNYMDYVDDACMVMFTFGQANRMRSALNNTRSGLLSSEGCQSNAGIKENTTFKNVLVFPNPSSCEISISFNLISNEKIDVEILNLMGDKILSFEDVKNSNIEINVENLASGSYFVKLKSQTSVFTQKIFITK